VAGDRRPSNELAEAVGEGIQLGRAGEIAVAETRETGDRGTPGSTSVVKRSPRVIEPSSSRCTRTAPISMTRSDSGSNPVVSMSSATSSRASPI
jgi:hypothetical protein